VPTPPTAQYLQPIAGLDAAMWVPPSRGQLFWLRRAPALFAPARGIGRGLVRWWAIATVTPSTNVTGLNLAYQAYLNHVSTAPGWPESATLPACRSS